MISLSQLWGWQLPPKQNRVSFNKITQATVAPSPIPNLIIIPPSPQELGPGWIKSFWPAHRRGELFSESEEVHCLSVSTIYTTGVLAINITLGTQMVWISMGSLCYTPHPRTQHFSTSQNWLHNKFTSHGYFTEDSMEIETEEQRGSAHRLHPTDCPSNNPSRPTLGAAHRFPSLPFLHTSSTKIALSSLLLLQPTLSTQPKAQYPFMDLQPNIILQAKQLKLSFNIIDVDKKSE